MTKNEFDLWKAETAKSVNDWRQDLISLYNRGVIFMYKGGVSGTYIEIDGDGRTAIGYYEGAIPHIGEAVFTEKYSKTFSDQATAIATVFEKLGYGRLVGYIAITGLVPA